MGKSVFDAEGNFVSGGVDLNSKGVVEYVVDSNSLRF